MSRVLKVLRTLRNHWKKSTFFAVLGYYGVEYGRDWHRNYMMMRDLSREALSHGLRPLPSGARNKHITVFLNPAAGNRKSKTKLEKYAEPLFHLAGYLVNVVRTERIDEARDLARIIEKTNIIVSAGGDGTLFETVTGLLRREDAEDALRKFPIAVLPLGTHNSCAARIFGRSGSAPEPPFVADAAMALVRHKIRAEDVMEVTSKDEDAEAPENQAETDVTKRKPFYALGGISIGQFREAQKLKDEMPSLFPNYFATFLSLYKTPEKYFKAEIRFLPTCVGCLNCRKKEEKVVVAKPEANKVVPEVKKGWGWPKMFSVFQPQVVHASNVVDESQQAMEPEIVQLVNPECGNWNSVCVDTSEFNIRVGGNGKLQLQVNRKFDKTDFMIEGLRRYRNEGGSYSQVIDCQEVEIIPLEGQEYMSIDNEEFEVKPLKIKCLPKKVYFFVPS